MNRQFHDGVALRDRLGSARAHGTMLVLGAMAACGALSGCISVRAPEKPIVIELNINIKQEVVYRLAADATKVIDSNKDIF